MTNDVSLSNALYERAKAVIPGGIYDHYGYSVRQTGPKFFQRVRVLGSGTLMVMNTSTTCVRTVP